MIAKVIPLRSAQTLRLVLVATLGLGAASAAKAKEIEYTWRQKIACTSDAMRFCSDAVPNVARVKACMISKKSSLSPGCRAQFGS